MLIKFSDIYNEISNLIMYLCYIQFNMFTLDAKLFIYKLPEYLIPKVDKLNKIIHSQSFLFMETDILMYARFLLIYSNISSKFCSVCSHFE